MIAWSGFWWYASTRIEREWDRFVVKQAQFGRQEACWEPPIDVLETEHELLILVALPGVNPDNVETVIQDGVLIISGQRTLPL